MVKRVETKARLGAGNVEIVIDGETLVMKPTLKACQAICRKYGGLVEVVRKVSLFDIETMIDVIGIGLDLQGRDLKDLPEKVFSTGLSNLVAPVTRFLTAISVGGRDPDDFIDKLREEGASQDPPRASV